MPAYMWRCFHPDSHAVTDTAENIAHAHTRPGTDIGSPDHHHRPKKKLIVDLTDCRSSISAAVMKHSNNSCFQDLDMPILCLPNQRGMVSSNRNISNLGTDDTSKARIIY